MAVLRKPARRGPVIFLVRLIVFLLMFTALAEGWLRTVTPASEVPRYYQDAQSMIFRFDPTGPRDGLYTVGRLASKGGKWHVNNAGWISATDYVPAINRDLPLIALFGDSYIEGFLTDTDQHVDSYLREFLEPAANVYAIGASGWYLEQYVVASRYITSLYKPDLLVVFINAGDVTDSLRENGVHSRNLWQITGLGNRFDEVAPTAVYAESRKARLAKLSAVIRYLVYNAEQVLPLMQNTAIPEPAAGVNATDASVTPGSTEAWSRLLLAADYMVGRLCADHPAMPIVFVFHSGRYLPAEALPSTPLFPDALAIQAVCAGRPQCYSLDMRLAFSLDWAAHQRRFESADGHHWNAYANRLVAETLAAFIEENHLLDTPSNADARRKTAHMMPWGTALERNR